MKDRKLMRLREYDYSQSGYYFVTICTERRREWFGEIVDGRMILNKNGEIAKILWGEIPIHFPLTEIDEFVVMPNHVHGIVVIHSELVRFVGNAYMRSLQDRTKMLLSKIIQQFKSSATRKINLLQNDFKFQWQKSFYDHVLRNEKSLNNLRQYIMNNPMKWALDIENRGQTYEGFPRQTCRDYYNKIIEVHITKGNVEVSR